MQGDGGRAMVGSSPVDRARRDPRPNSPTLQELEFLQERQGVAHSLGWASLNHFGRLEAIGVVFGCLVPGPRMIEVEDIAPLAWTDQIEQIGSGISWLQSKACSRLNTLLFLRID